MLYYTNTNLTKTNFLFYINKTKNFYGYIDTDLIKKSLYFYTVTSLTQFNLFSDLLASDFPNYKLRFLMIYNVISLVFNNRIIIKGLLFEDGIIDTVVQLFVSAGWYERETWDLYGIFFINNLDLRRILNDYGFVGHPFKKDFPLSGFLEYVFVFRLGLLLSNQINMMQEFRFFNRGTPWTYNYLNN